MKKIKNVVFDFDGTLATLTIDFNALKNKLHALEDAFECNLLEYRALPALEWVDKVSACIGKDNKDLGKEFHTRCRFLIISTEVEAAKHGVLFDYSYLILQKLKEKGINTAVITRNTISAVNTVAPDLNSYTNCILAREHVSNYKPEPEHILTALDKIGGNPEETLMVGDHCLDVMTGHNVGAYTAAVASGSLSVEELQECNPDYLYSDCREMMNDLFNLKI